MTSMMDKLKAAEAAKTAAAVAVTPKTEAAVQVEQGEETSFQIDEAQIQQNPVYQIVTDTSKSLKERVEAATALRTYNPELTPEENRQHREAFEEFLLYSENQVLELAKRQTKFTNSDAFSLYDQAIIELQDNLMIFKGNVEPLMNAFGVMQRARAAGIAPNQLMREVQDMKDAKAKMDAELAEIGEKVAAKQAEIKAAEKLARRIQEDLQAAQTSKTTASLDAMAAQATLDTEKDKFFFNRDKHAVTEAKLDLASANKIAERAESNIKAHAEQAKSVADTLAEKQAELAALVTQADAVAANVGEMEVKLTENPDTVALSKLLEITGKDYKAKRDELTNSVETLITKSVADFEKSMGRFDSGKKEVTVMKDTIVNVAELNSIVVAADSAARVTEAAFIAEQKATVDQIKAEKGDDAIYDPKFEVARNQYRHGSEHAQSFLSTGNRATEFADKLARQEGTYAGMAEAFEQKFQDAKRLRTNAAVDVSSKLLTATKSLEIAIASERTSATDDILADLSDSANRTTSNIFNMLVENQAEGNDRMVAALRQSIEAAEAISQVTDELRDQARRSTVSQEAIRRMGGEIQTLTEGFANVGARTAHEVLGGDDFDDKVMQAAVDANASRQGGSAPAAPALN